MAERATRRWYVISLRPQGEHAAMRRAAARAGAGVIALSPWRLSLREDADTRAALARALAASRVVFTSPAAVRAAARLQRLRPRRAQAWCAVGGGTLAALRRAGVREAVAPSRMDSEGLLELPALRAVRGASVGVVTAPGGRDALVPALRRRGAEVVRADVYERVAVALPANALARLQALRAPAVPAVSSGEALRRVLRQLPPPLAARLRGGRIVVASERLRKLAADLGFREVVVAAGPRPADLVAAAAR